MVPPGNRQALVSVALAPVALDSKRWAHYIPGAMSKPVNTVKIRKKTTSGLPGHSLRSNETVSLDPELTLHFDFNRMVNAFPV